MFRKRIFLSVVVSAFAWAAQAQDDNAAAPHTNWGTSGNWDILVDPSVGNGCYMQITLDDGTLVQIGLVPDRDGGFFAAYNAKWTNIENEAAGTVSFDFGKSLFGGDYIGAVKNDLPGGYAFFNNPEFLKEFAKRNDVSITGDKGNAFKVELKGTLKAINAVRNCDAEQKK